VVQRLHEQGPEPAVLLELNRAAQGLVELVLHDPTRAMVLTTGRGVLPYAVTHPIHRLLLAVVAGRRLGMQQKELLELALCALSADLSLYGLPPEILDKPGPLSPAERARVEQHPLQTVAALLSAGELSPALRRRLLVAFELRLGADRSGYPVPLVWPELHPFSRLIAVGDAYDALLSERPWRPAQTPSEALSWLQQQRGLRYDPLMVDELEDLLRTHLPGMGA
jgi:HD-GYP domain-containing protein (c-di-GMP phosphodiesterase class II)